jgi:hypothetical protein
MVGYSIILSERETAANTTRSRIRARVEQYSAIRMEKG